LKIKKSRLIVLFLLVLLSCQQLLAQEIKSPEKYFGHMMGQEGILLNYLKSLNYYAEIAAQSPRMKMVELGKTTDGNPFNLLIISSAENMEKLEKFKQARDRLADPRKISFAEAKSLAEKLPVVVFHATSIHSSEISTAQVAPELVYKLVTSESSDIRRIRENAIVLICPSANPDGQVKYNEWYNKHKGKPWEGRMPWLYHTYVGHDNNRDWVNLYFPEQRLTATRIHMEWHPVYSHEMHEFGSTAARIFLPPYKDPIDPNTAPSVVSTMNSLGMAASHALTSEGKGGVVTQAHFDLFTPARAFQVYHGAGRILTETARGNFARSMLVTENDFLGRNWQGADYHPLKRSWNFPLPWQPGEWKFRDRVEYQISASLALMRQAANNRYQYNMAFFKALHWAVEGKGWPFAWIIPQAQKSPEAARKLIFFLRQGGVEVHTLKQDVEIDGDKYQKGSYVVYLRQPYGAWAKTLLEIQNYPDLRKRPTDPPVMPYDVTGHTLPLLMGVDAFKVTSPFKADVDLLSSTQGKIRITSGDKGKYLSISTADNSAYLLANRLLKQGVGVSRLQKDLNGARAGDFLIQASEASAEMLEEILQGRIVQLGRIDLGDDNDSLSSLRAPRVAVYESWGGVMDAGWTRKVLEDYGFEHVTLRNAEIAAGNLLEKYDAIIFPNGFSPGRLINDYKGYAPEYSKGVGEAGISNLKNFLHQGGTIVSWGGAAAQVAGILDLPIENKAADVSRNDFFAPGSVVLVELDTSHPVNFGMNSKAAVQIRRGPLLIPKATLNVGPATIGIYPEYDARLSGFLLGEDFMQGSGAVVVQPSGKGKVVLFSYLPQFRGMTHAAFKQVFNTLFWSLEK
jgi:hypothetical protein